MTRSCPGIAAAPRKPRSRQPDIQRARLAALALALIVNAGGCSSYVDGGRTPGEFTDDIGIHANVKARLVKAPELAGFKIDVDVKGGVVYLFGWVRSEAERRRALQLAQNVKGVKRVEDRLAIKP